MQLVRLLYTQDDTREGIAGYERKIKEAKLARDLEAQYSKKWVVGKYLNTVPYGTVGGQTAIGAEAASRLYFNKPRQGPDAAPGGDARRHAAGAVRSTRRSNNESGTIAAPQRGAGQDGRARLHHAREGPDRDEEGPRAEHEEATSRSARERYVLDYIQSELIKEYGAETVKRGGFKVYTTIDLKKQQEARAAIAERMGNVGPSSAIATINPRNGDIVAMASSQEYGKSKYNLAAQGKRQPGSAFKTMVLMTALRLGVNPNSTTYSSRGHDEARRPAVRVAGEPVGRQDLQRHRRRQQEPRAARRSPPTTSSTPS